MEGGARRGRGAGILEVEEGAGVGGGLAYWSWRRGQELEGGWRTGGGGVEVACWRWRGAGVLVEGGAGAGGGEEACRRWRGAGVLELEEGGRRWRGAGVLELEGVEDLPFLTRRKDSQQVASGSMRRKWWSSSQEFPLLSQAANRLLSMHATTCATERNWSTWGRLYTKSRNRLNLSKAEKLVYQGE